MRAAFAPSLFRLLAVLALLGQVLAGALVIPDDARAAEAGAIARAGTLCGAPAGPHRPDHDPTHREPACALSLSLASHAAPVALHPMAPLPGAAVGPVAMARPLTRAPPPRRLRAFAPSRGPPFGA